MFVPKMRLLGRTHLGSQFIYKVGFRISYFGSFLAQKLKVMFLLSSSMTVFSLLFSEPPPLPQLLLFIASS